MDGWTDGRIDGLSDGQTERGNGWVNERTNGRARLVLGRAAGHPGRRAERGREGGRETSNVHPTKDVDLDVSFPHYGRLNGEHSKKE